ncbi:MAG: hypothetical protein KatS3mg111_2851 [Pirellulaceae bacterium]|nr:MAG: hypothetical protein KatS3mg111_2851 [Pirellulaceae bacterium]
MASAGCPCGTIGRLSELCASLSELCERRLESLARQVQESVEFGRSPVGTVAWRQRPRNWSRNKPILAEGQIHWRGGPLDPDARRRILDNAPDPCQAPRSMPSPQLGRVGGCGGGEFGLQPTTSMCTSILGQNWIALSGLGWLVVRVPRAAHSAATPLALCPGLSWRCPFGAICGIWGF